MKKLFIFVALALVSNIQSSEIQKSYVKKAIKDSNHSAFRTRFEKKYNVTSNVYEKWSDWKGSLQDYKKDYETNEHSDAYKLINQISQDKLKLYANLAESTYNTRLLLNQQNTTTVTQKSELPYFIMAGGGAALLLCLAMMNYKQKSSYYGYRYDDYPFGIFGVLLFPAAFLTTIIGGGAFAYDQSNTPSNSNNSNDNNTEVENALKIKVDLQQVLTNKQQLYKIISTKDL
jgi:hypothetical protein